MKGISLISGVIFIAFLIAATALVYQSGMPVVEKIQCAATLDKMKKSFLEIDRNVQDVSSEGKGSKRTLNMNIDFGRFHLSGENDSLYWEYECDSEVMSPRTSKSLGNVLFGSHMDTRAYEGQCSGETAYILENEYLKACFKKIGSQTSYVSYNTTQVLLSLYQKDLNQLLPLEYLEITVDNEPSSMTGQGYTRLEGTGHNLPYGKLIAFMQSDYNLNYSVNFILESGSDFLQIRGEK